MNDLMGRFLSKADREQIESCVRKAESRTRGEIVVMVVPASDGYPEARLLGATAFSLPVAVALTPVLGGVFWAGSSNMWVFLAVLIPLFLIFHELVKRINFLKRRFIPSKEMEEEVREGASLQFFRKGLYRTHEEIGVLIYISVFERSVWVLGDRGINAAIGESRWNDVVASITRAINDGRPVEGICQAVGEVGRILENEFPVRQSDQDELGNVIVDHESP